MLLQCYTGDAVCPYPFLMMLLEIVAPMGRYPLSLPAKVCRQMAMQKVLETCTSILYICHVLDVVEPGGLSLMT